MSVEPHQIAIVVCQTTQGAMHVRWLACSRCGVMVCASETTVELVTEHGANAVCTVCITSIASPEDFGNMHGQGPAGRIMPLIDAVKAWRKVRTKERR